jgi:glycylpeptide N-tetradecanoyltransferase
MAFSHRFWDSQPIDNSDDSHGQIYDSQKVMQDVVRSEDCLNLPPGFAWSHLDVNSDNDLDDIYHHLKENYVDGGSRFRYHCSRQFIRWSLSPPGYIPEWHVGIRLSKNNLLVALVTAIPFVSRIRGEDVRTPQINFLCISRKLRGKRLAPVLVREITRRILTTNAQGAIYTAGLDLPGAICHCKYYHRPLNPRKLVETGFMSMNLRANMRILNKLYSIPRMIKTPGLRPAIADDLDAVSDLITTYFAKLALTPKLTNEEIRHWLLPRNKTVETYVVEDSMNGVITGLVSWTWIPLLVTDCVEEEELNVAYLYYVVSTTTPICQLVEDSLILIKDAGADVVNCLNIMDNLRFIEKLKFAEGTGTLNYYIYNWACPKLDPGDVGVVIF